MRQLQVRLQQLALPGMENQIPEGQGNLLKGIEKKAGKLIFEWKPYIANLVCKKRFLFQVEII
jgi:hypothetical protein